MKPDDVKYFSVDKSDWGPGPFATYDELCQLNAENHKALQHAQAALEKQKVINNTLRAELDRSPFCPDCRDKVRGQECPRCRYQRAEAKLERVSGETALREQINRIVGEMRSERSRYKSHDLGLVDSVSSSRVDEWADELEALLAPAQK